MQTEMRQASSKTSATEIKELNKGENGGGSRSKNGTSNRSAAIKARTNDIFTERDG